MFAQPGTGFAVRLGNGQAATAYIKGNSHTLHTREDSMIQFGKQPAGQTVLGQIKHEVQNALIAAGMPGRLYLIVSGTPPSTAWLRENGLGDPIEANPTISSKDGRVMYNFGGKSELNGVGGRLQGNYFLPKDGFRVDRDTHKSFLAAKEARANAQAANRLRMSGSAPVTEEDLELGESTE